MLLEFKMGDKSAIMHIVNLEVHLCTARFIFKWGYHNFGPFQTSKIIPLSTRGLRYAVSVAKQKMSSFPRYE